MTKITKSNVDAAMRDDAAHIDYLKRDVLDDQKYGGKYKDEDQTADEKHISKLAGDIKHDMHDKSFLSKHWVHNKTSLPLYFFLILLAYYNFVYL